MLAQPILPDSTMSPGVIILTADSACVCTKGYSATVRDVPRTRKDSVYWEYGIRHHKKGEYEIDHLISLELGGSNDIKNLWPESYKTQPWNAHVKDQLEDHLHWMVCHGKISLRQAQFEISRDWIKAYKKYIAPEPRPGRGHR